MKKKILLLTTSVILSMGLMGCASNSASNSLRCLVNDFTVVEEKENNSFLGARSQIIYDNETKVEYLIIYDSYRCGITPIYNTDGTVKVYQEKER